MASPAGSPPAVRKHGQYRPIRRGIGKLQFLCLTSIADEVGLSSNYAGHIFRQYAQKSVSQYILEVRMDLAGDYLKNTTLPLNKILERVGMEKNNYFYTRFKNYFGMSLNEYRQQFATGDVE